MTITQLKYILAVSDFQNFTTAAQHCKVTQPTLSMQIQKLEEELDVKIFNRNTKPITLTVIGEKIIQQSKEIVNQSNIINDIVKQEKGFISGVFKIGIIPTIMPTLLPLFLKSFTKCYPKIYLVIEELKTETIIKKLHEGLLDAAIVATPLENTSIIERVIFYEPFVVFVPNKHPLASKSAIEIDDIDVGNILVLKNGHSFKNSVINLFNTHKAKIKRQFNLNCDNLETLIKLSKQGIAITILPYLNTLELTQKEKYNIIPFENPKPAREVSLIYHKSQLKTNLINALKSTIDREVNKIISFTDVKIISPILTSTKDNDY